MKNTLIILFIFFTTFSFSQYTLVTTLDHDTCLDKKISIVFYVVLDSTYSAVPATTPTLNALIDTLNSKFSRICVTFQNCSTVYIPNFPYNKWKKSVTDPVVTSNWYTYKTLNFYLVDSIKPEASNTEEAYLGYTYPPPPVGSDSTKDVIVIEKSTLVPPYPFVLHQLGHYFGLVHTDAEIGTGPPASPPPPGTVVSQEFADGSNCAVHGDCICDTEADPGVVTLLADGKGQRYILPLDNYMASYSPCRFTQQQYNLMAYIIFTRRLYLH